MHMQQPECCASIDCAVHGVGCARCGAVRCGAVWYSAAYCGAVWGGMVHVVRYGVVRHSTVAQCCAIAASDSARVRCVGLWLNLLFGVRSPRMA